MNQTEDHRHRLLVAAAKNIKVWFTKVRKIKAIYHTLDMFNIDVTQKCLIAEGWCPVSELSNIQRALKVGTVSRINIQTAVYDLADIDDACAVHVACKLCNF